MATDWAALRVEYINSALQYKDLAAKHGLKEGTVRQRGNRENWGDERNAASRAVTQASNQKIGLSRVEELVKFNEDDVRVAKAIRAKAANMLKNANTPTDISALARAFDTAQKIGRLALGATTENNGVTGEMALMTAHMDEEKYLEARKQALGEC